MRRLPLRRFPAPLLVGLFVAVVAATRLPAQAPAAGTLPTLRVRVVQDTLPIEGAIVRSAHTARATDAYVEAQALGIAAATPGAPLMGIDAAMAHSLDHAGYGGAFLRPVFHGVGIEHEEAPIPGGHAVIHGEEKVERVEPGMALAIGNCGIYRETFGVRFEDTVWVSEGGPVALTHHRKVLTAAAR